MFNIESPVFESKPMEAQFLSLTKALGEIGTIVQQKRLSISRGHTHIGMASASSGRRGKIKLYHYFCPIIYTTAEPQSSFYDIVRDYIAYYKKNVKIEDGKLVLR